MDTHEERRDVVVDRGGLYSERLKSVTLNVIFVTC